jgi:hypothetical protein
MKPNEKRAKTAIVLVSLVLFLEIIMLISDYFEYRLLESLQNGFFVSDQEAESNDLRQSILGILYLIVFIISGITFIMWFRRAYYNLHLKVSNLSYTEGWAAGSWFVPIANLFRPYQIMKELNKETENLLSQHNEDHQNITSTRLIGLWWALWILTGILSQIVLRLFLDAETIDDFVANSITNMSLSVLSIPLALITIRIIKDYSTLEQKLIEIHEENAQTN